MDTEKFKARITELVQSHWETAQSALLLSALGSMLNSEFDVEKETVGIKLAPFLRDAMNGVVKVVQHPTNPIILGAVPGDVNVESAAQLFSSKVRISEGHASREYVRYEKTLWTAFTTPIPPGKQRFIAVGETVEVEDKVEGAPHAAGFIEIQKTDLVAPLSYPAGERFSAISYSIEAWSRRNGVDISEKKTRIEKNKIEDRSVLEVILDSLGPNELSEITLPLTAIKIFLKTPVK